LKYYILSLTSVAFVLYYSIRRSNNKNHFCKKITFPLGSLGANVHQVLNGSGNRTSANPLGTVPSLEIVTAIAWHIFFFLWQLSHTTICQGKRYFSV